MAKSQRLSMWMRTFTIYFTTFVFVTGTYYYFANSYRTALIQERGVLGGVVKHLEMNLNVRLKALQFLASEISMEKSNTDDIRGELVRSVDVLNFFNARIFDKEGRLVAEAWHSLYALEVHDRDSFNQVLIGRQVISDVIVSEIMQKPYVSLRVPMFNKDGEVGAALVGGILLDEIGKLIEAEWLPANHYVFIKDNNNRIIYYPEFKNGFGQHDLNRDMNIIFDSKLCGEVEDKSRDDEEDKLYIYNTLDNSNWQIVMVVPLNQVYITSWQESGYHFATFCLILLCTGLLYRNLWQLKYFEENLQRLRIERLMSVNQLAAGLAHEIRNPLTPIKGFVQMMVRKVDQAPNPGHLGIILSEIERIEQLLGEFQQLTVPLKNSEFVKVDLEQMTNSIVSLMYSQAVLKNITLTTTNTDGAFPLNYLDIMGGTVVHKKYHVLGDKSQLKQVLINLLKNAIDAVDQNGVIRVALSKKDKMVRITIKDNGIGMSKEVLSKIGTPFFTTKDGGNGVGLSICYNIIEGHGGRIEITSEVGKGTIFSVLLPYVE